MLRTSRNVREIGRTIIRLPDDLRTSQESSQEFFEPSNLDYKASLVSWWLLSSIWQLDVISIRCQDHTEMFAPSERSTRMPDDLKTSQECSQELIKPSYPGQEASSVS